MENLWGDLKSLSARHERLTDILSEQAAVLAQQTNDRLQGKLQTEVGVSSATGEEMLGVAFYVFAPQLNFRYRVLRVLRSVDREWPVNVMGRWDEKSRDCGNEKEFRDALKAIFTDSRLHEVLGTLLSRLRESA